MISHHFRIRAVTIKTATMPHRKSLMRSAALLAQLL